MGKPFANRKPESERPQGDFYPTPSLMPKELLERGFFNFDKNVRIFDPCCGKYAIGNVLRQYGYTNITEKDIMYGDNFLEKDKETGKYIDLTKYDVIIMNPPFKLFDEFVKKAKLQAKYVFCIGKMNFYGAHNRNIEGLWKGLKWVLPFDRMIAFDMPEIDGKVECGMLVSNWFIWDWEYEKLPMIKVIDVQKYIRPSTKREKE